MTMSIYRGQIQCDPISFYDNFSKALNQLSTEGKYLDTIKAGYQKPATNITVSSKIRKKIRVSVVSFTKRIS